MEEEINENSTVLEPGELIQENIISTIGAATMEVISTGMPHMLQHPNDVKFQVRYPKDYKGEKIMPEGVTIVSKESAEHFTSLKIGKIVN